MQTSPNLVSIQFYIYFAQYKG